MIEIDLYNTFDDVFQYWQELNQHYKGGELTFDWHLHHALQRRSHSETDGSFKIIVASDAGRCIGIFPFTRVSRPGDSAADHEWIYGEEAIISREYFCSPKRIGEMMPYLPAHSCTDLSCFYRPRNLAGFVPRPGCIVDLMPSEAAYLLSINAKRRGEYLRTERMNMDIEVVLDNTVREDVIGSLREQYIAYWMAKAGPRAKDDAEDSKMKILKDFVLFAHAEKMGKLVVLYFFLNGRLVAANFAVRREGNRVDDYLCLRDTSATLSKRRLGVFAIIKNMQHCRSLGIRYYDLSDFRAAYKQAFINTSYSYWTPEPDLLWRNHLSAPLPSAEIKRTRRSA